MSFPQFDPLEENSHYRHEEDLEGEPEGDQEEEEEEPEEQVEGEQEGDQEQEQEGEGQGGGHRVGPRVLRIFSSSSSGYSSTVNGNVFLQQHNSNHNNSNHGIGDDDNEVDEEGEEADDEDSHQGHPIHSFIQSQPFFFSMAIAVPSDFPFIIIIHHRNLFIFF